MSNADLKRPLEDEDVMVPAQWSPGESQRAIERLASAMEKLGEQVTLLPTLWRQDIQQMQGELRTDYVRREVFEERARRSDEWRVDIDRDVHATSNSIDRVERALAAHIEQSARDAARYPTKEELARARNQLWAVLGVLAAIVVPLLIAAVDRVGK